MTHCGVFSQIAVCLSGAFCLRRNRPFPPSWSALCMPSKDGALCRVPMTLACCKALDRHGTGAKSESEAAQLRTYFKISQDPCSVSKQTLLYEAGKAKINLDLVLHKGYRNGAIYLNIQTYIRCFVRHHVRIPQPCLPRRVAMAQDTYPEVH